MPINDYVCPSCGKKTEFIDLSNDSEDKICSDCVCKMQRCFPNTCNFKLVYNNQKDICTWGKEGYASSQYWEQHKKKE